MSKRGLLGVNHGKSRPAVRKEERDGYNGEIEI